MAREVDPKTNTPIVTRRHELSNEQRDELMGVLALEDLEQVEVAIDAIENVLSLALSLDETEANNPRHAHHRDTYKKLTKGVGRARKAVMEIIATHEHMHPAASQELKMRTGCFDPDYPLNFLTDIDRDLSYWERIYTAIYEYHAANPKESRRAHSKPGKRDCSVFLFLNVIYERFSRSDLDNRQSFIEAAYRCAGYGFSDDDYRRLCREREQVSPGWAQRAKPSRSISGLPTPDMIGWIRTFVGHKVFPNVNYVDPDDEGL